MVGCEPSTTAERPAPKARRVTLDIGVDGATVAVAAPWFRQDDDKPGDGKDEFELRSNEELYAAVVQLDRVVETEQDFQQAADALLAELGDRARGGGRVTVTRTSQGARATLDFQGEFSGIDLCYKAAYFSRHGLTYRILLWSPRVSKGLLDREGARFVAGFRFPPEDSDWGRRSQPVRMTRRVGERQVSFMARPSVFRTRADGGALIQLTSPDGMHAIYVYETDGYSADNVLETVMESLNNQYPEEPFREMERRTVSVGGVESREMICDDGTLAARHVALPLGGDRYLDIRYHYPGDPMAERADRDLFFETFKLSQDGNLLALPRVEPSFEPRPLNRRERAIYEAAERVGHTRLGYHNRARRLADGTIIVANAREVVLAADAQGDLPDRLVYRGDRWTSSLDAVRWCGRWVVATGEGDLYDASETPPKLMSRRARAIDVSGDRLIVATPGERHSLLGMQTGEGSGPDSIAIERAGAAPRVVAELRGRQVQHLSAAGDETRALVATRPNSAVVRRGDWQGCSLMVVDLESGETRDLHDWRHVVQITPAGNGWLVTGGPDGLPDGVYAVAEGRAPAPLMTGDDVVGLSLDRRSFCFVTSHAIEENPEGGLAFYRAPVSVLREHGALCQPFCAAGLNRVAEAWIEELPGESLPSAGSEDDVRRLLRAASRISREQLGAPLPTAPHEVDALCRAVYGEGALSPGARLLVSLLITRGLLDEGAEWVESDAGEALDWLLVHHSVPPNAFAVAHTPAEIFASVFLDSEGSWNPVETWIDMAEGRCLLLGLDPQGLVAEVTAREIGGASQTLASGSAEEVVALLAETAGNRYFRSAAYDQLALAGRVDVLLQSAKAMSASEHATESDVSAWFSARLESAQTEREAHRVAEELLAALDDHADSAPLYLLLGAAYEKAGAPADHSRQCYRRALDRMSWGAVGEAARERLERLEEKL